MPLANIEQPNYLYINKSLRLKTYDGDYSPALNWYRDKEVYYYSEGITDENKIPDETYVRCMYEYLQKEGELYFIEVLESESFIPIGDVTLKPQNPPIVIGVKQYRGKGIGRLVMQKIIERAREIGITKFTDTMVFDYNIRSQKMFESLGFHMVRQSGNERYYELTLF